MSEALLLLAIISIPSADTPAGVASLIPSASVVLSLVDDPWADPRPILDALDASDCLVVQSSGSWQGTYYSAPWEDRNDNRTHDFDGSDALILGGTGMLHVRFESPQRAFLFAGGIRVWDSWADGPPMRTGWETVDKHYNRI